MYWSHLKHTDPQCPLLPQRLPGHVLTNLAPTLRLPGQLVEHSEYLVLVVLLPSSVVLVSSHSGSIQRRDLVLASVLSLAVSPTPWSSRLVKPAPPSLHHQP